MYTQVLNLRVIRITTIKLIKGKLRLIKKLVV